MKICCLNLKHLFAALFLIFAMENYAQEVPKIRIDPSQVYGGTVSEYFDTVEYIPLETTKESLFGTIQNIRFSKNYFAISDPETKSILFFGNNGSFMKKIKFGSHQYPILSTNEKGNIVILNFDRKNNAFFQDIFDSNGKKISTTKENNDIATSVILDSTTTIHFLDCYNIQHTTKSDTVVHLAELKENGMVKKNLLPISLKDNFLFCNLFYSLNSKTYNIKNGALYVSIPFENSVYKITKDTTVKMYNIIFPVHKTLPVEILKNANQKTIDSLNRNSEFAKKVVSSIKNIFVYKDHLFLSLGYSRNYKLMNDPESYNLMYNLNDNKTVSMEKLIPDESVFFLPFSSKTFFNEGGFTFYDNYLYSNVSSLDMFTAYEANKSKNPQYSPVLEKYFKTQNRKSNLVIVKMKLK